MKKWALKFRNSRAILKLLLDSKETKFPLILSGIILTCIIFLMTASLLSLKKYDTLIENSYRISDHLIHKKNAPTASTPLQPHPSPAPTEMFYSGPPHGPAAKPQLPSLRLTGIGMVKDSARATIEDGQGNSYYVGLNDIAAGMKVTSISEDQVVLSSDDGRTIILKMKPGGP